MPYVSKAKRSVVSTWVNLFNGQTTPEIARDDLGALVGAIGSALYGFGPKTTFGQQAELLGILTFTRREWMARIGTVSIDFNASVTCNAGYAESARRLRELRDTAVSFLHREDHKQRCMMFSCLVTSSLLAVDPNAKKGSDDSLEYLAGLGDAVFKVLAPDNGLPTVVPEGRSILHRLHGQDWDYSLVWFINGILERISAGHGHSIAAQSALQGMLAYLRRECYREVGLFERVEDYDTVLFESVNSLPDSILLLVDEEYQLLKRMSLSDALTALTALLLQTVDEAVKQGRIKARRLPGFFEMLSREFYAFNMGNQIDSELYDHGDVFPRDFPEIC